MSILAEIRAVGGTIELGPGGSVRAANVPADLLQQAKGQKEYITRTLNAEVFDGMRYMDSAYYAKLERLYSCAKSAARYPVLQKECERLIAFAWELDAAFMESIDSGLGWIEANGEMVMELVDQIAVRSGWLLEGERLRAAVVEELCQGSKIVNAEALA